MPKISQPFTEVGEFIAAQRRAARLSLRQLADQAGVSNPYLSQIERGLRRPSAEVLQQVAKALRVSAETLYVRAGILDPADHPADGVQQAILADTAITERQKQTLIEVYASFLAANAERDRSAEPGGLAGPRPGARRRDASPGRTHMSASSGAQAGASSQEERS